MIKQKFWKKIFSVATAIIIFLPTVLVAQQAFALGNLQLAQATCNAGATDQTTCESGGGSWQSASGSCTCPATQTPTNPNSSSQTNQGVNPNGGSLPGVNSGSGSCGACPCGYSLSNGNSGVCLPPTPFNGGIAAEKSLSGLITTVIKILLTLAGVIAVILIVVGGFWYMTAGGNEEQAEKGRKAITNAVIGLIAILLAFAIVQIVTNSITQTFKL